VERRFLDDTEPVLCKGFRGLPLLFLSSMGGRFFNAGLGGVGRGAAAVAGAWGGLRDVALGAESALLMVAAV
jgi:hypothetical protein